MESTQPLKTNSKNCFSKFSPDGKNFACVNLSKLAVYSVKNATLVHEYNHPEAIESFTWAPDSEFLLCTSITKALSYVFSLEHPDWRCNVDLGTARLQSSIWAPDSRHILTLVELNLYAYVWSLSNRKIRVIERLKKTNPILHFSPDGHYVAAIENGDFGEVILVISTNTWRKRKRLVMGLKDIQGFTWHPESDHICAWEFPIGKRLAVSHVDGRKVVYLELDSTINFAIWAGDILFVACVDDSVILINGITWNTIAKLRLVTNFMGRNSCDVFKEVQLPKLSHSLQLKSKALTLALSSTHELMVSTRLQYQKVTAEAMASVTSDTSDEPEEVERLIKLRCCGVSDVQFSSGNLYMACRSHYNPRLVWIWHIETLKLTAVLKQQSDVTCMEWEPSQHRLLVCTTSQPSPHLFIWTPKEVSAIPMPKLGTDSLINAQWHPTQATFLSNSLRRTVICSFEEDSDEMSPTSESFLSSCTTQQDAMCEYVDELCSNTSKALKLNLDSLHNSERSQSEPSATESKGTYLLSGTVRQGETCATKSTGSTSYVHTATNSRQSSVGKTKTSSYFPHTTDTRQSEVSDTASKELNPNLDLLHHSDTSQSEHCASTSESSQSAPSATKSKGTYLLSGTDRQDETCTTKSTGSTSYIHTANKSRQSSVGKTKTSSYFPHTTDTRQSDSAGTSKKSYPYSAYPKDRKGTDSRTRSSKETQSHLLFSTDSKETKVSSRKTKGSSNSESTSCKDSKQSEVSKSKTSSSSKLQSAKCSKQGLVHTSKTKRGPKSKFQSGKDFLQHEINLKFKLHIDFKRRSYSSSSEDSCASDLCSESATTAESCSTAMSKGSILTLPPTSEVSRQSEASGAIRKTSSSTVPSTKYRKSSTSATSSKPYTPSTTNTTSSAKTFLPSSTDSRQSASSGNKGKVDSMWCATSGGTRRDKTSNTDTASRGNGSLKVQPSCGTKSYTTSNTDTASCGNGSLKVQPSCGTKSYKTSNTDTASHGNGSLKVQPSCGTKSYTTSKAGLSSHGSKSLQEKLSPWKMKDSTSNTDSSSHGSRGLTSGLTKSYTTSKAGLSSHGSKSLQDKLSPWKRRDSTSNTDSSSHGSRGLTSGLTKRCTTSKAELSSQGSKSLQEETSHWKRRDSTSNTDSSSHGSKSLASGSTTRCTTSKADSSSYGSKSQKDQTSPWKRRDATTNTDAFYSAENRLTLDSSPDLDYTTPNYLYQTDSE